MAQPNASGKMSTEDGAYADKIPSVCVLCFLGRFIFFFEVRSFLNWGKEVYFIRYTDLIFKISEKLDSLMRWRI